MGIQKGLDYSLLFANNKTHVKHLNFTIKIFIYESCIIQFTFKSFPSFYRSALFLHISHQYLTNVQCCNRRNHGQTIHPTDIFISMNLLQMPCVITWDQKNQKKMSLFFNFEYQKFSARVNHKIKHNDTKKRF